MKELYGLEDKAQIDPAAVVLTKSFFEDPLMVYFFPDEAKRQKQTHKMFTFLVKYGLRRGEVYATSMNFEGASIWLPSENAEMSSWQMIRSGAPLVMIKMGFGTMNRMMNYMKYSTDMHKKFAPFPHWYLQFVGVSPDYQGKGFASKLLKPMLRRIDAQGLPCFLETQNPMNIALYEHFGFKLVNEGIIPETEVRHIIMLRGKSKTPKVI